MPTLEAVVPETRAKPAPRMRAKPAPRAPLPEGMRYTQKMAKKLGLRYVGIEALTLSRRRRGKSFSYHRADGGAIRDPKIILRLKSLAVPPAYEDVFYAEDPQAHIQAIGRDAAGRLQYRYHPEWVKVRELRKARRLANLAEALPAVRRSVARYLALGGPQRELAMAAIIELVTRSAIRPGSEAYARLRGTRGAATLLKSNVVVAGETVSLKFRAKGGKIVVKEIVSPKLCTALSILRELPGRRLFQYRLDCGDVRPATARDVNLFLREIAGVQISLKDFRTLLASVSVLEALARAAPAATKRGRRRQVLEAIRAAAEDLANTPTICAKSYVHEAVINAFEEGALEQFAETLRNSRSVAKREQLLIKVMAAA